MSDETEVTGVEIRQSVLIATPVFVLKNQLLLPQKGKGKRSMFSGKSVMLEGFNEELKEAEAMVKEISEEQVSLLMLKAMAGYPIF